MQVPPVIPSVTAPASNELKPEPVTRTAPVVMGDAAVLLDPSIILKTPVPISQGPRIPSAPRPATDQEGPIYTSPEQAEEADSVAHIARLVAQLNRADTGPNTVRWPLPLPQNGGAPQATGNKQAQQHQESDLPTRQSAQQSSESTPALATNPRAAIDSLKQGLSQSPMLALALLINASQAETPVLLNRIPAQGSNESQQALGLLMHGQLLWQGEFTPGVQGRVYREDAYGPDPKNPSGPLAKGAQISVELMLPTLGKMLVRGVQIADSVSLAIQPQGPGRTALKSHFAELKSQLANAQLGFVNLQFQD